MRPCDTDSCDTATVEATQPASQASQLEAQGRIALTLSATEMNHPLADLLDWYKADLEDLGEMAIAQAREVVNEYLTNREGYRPGLPLLASTQGDDDRIRCATCQRRRPTSCSAGGKWTADPATPHRCTGYRPQAGQQDQRPGSERWTGASLAAVNDPGPAPPLPSYCPISPDPAIEEAMAERYAIQTIDGHLTDQEAQQQAELFQQYLSHTMGDARATGCCHAPTGRYCETGRQLWRAYADHAKSTIH